LLQQVMRPSDFSTGLSDLIPALYPFRVLLFYTLYSDQVLSGQNPSEFDRFANFLPTIDPA